MLNKEKIIQQDHRMIHIERIIWKEMPMNNYCICHSSKCSKSPFKKKFSRAYSLKTKRKKI